MHQDIRTICILGRSGPQTSSLVGALAIALVLCQASAATEQQNAVSDYNVPQEVARCMKSLGTSMAMANLTTLC